MEYPYGHPQHHHSHQHHHRRNEEEEYGYPPPPQQPPPPPMIFESPYPPPTQVYHTSHVPAGPPDGMMYPPPPPHNSYAPPPQQDYYHHQQQSDGYNYPDPPPPAVTHVQHVSHNSSNGLDDHRPHFPSIVHHHSHQKDGPDLSGKATVRVFCKAEPNYSLTVLDGKVILSRSDPSDPSQHWFKDLKYSTKVKDEEGFPSFALINKATGLAMKHSAGATQPVQLTPYDPNTFDESILWTESRDLGDGFRTVRMINNIRLNVDAFNGDKNHGGVREGTPIVLWEWKKGENQRWKIIPY